MMDKDPNTYTSFQPLITEEANSSFSFSRFFEFGRKSTSSPKSDVPDEENLNGSRKLAQEALGEDMPKVPQPKISKSESSSPTVVRKEKGKYRNVRTILRRLSAIAIDRRWHQSTGDFKHNFKQYWMPDEHCKECYECGDKFNTFRRRHHCRVCGQIFCRKCCNQVVSGKVMGFSGDIRVCNYCYKIVQAYLNDNLDKSIEALREDMKVYSSVDDSTTSDQLFSGSGSLNSSRSSLTGHYFEGRDLTPRIPRAGSSNSLPSAIERDIHTRSPTPVRSVFDAFGVTPKEANTIKQDYLRDLWHEITDPYSRLELQSHRYRLKTYHNCFVGHELVDWLITYGKANNRAQAVAGGQDLLDHGWIEAVHATDEGVFRDEYMLYQPGKIALQDMESNPNSTSQLAETDVSPKTSSAEESKYQESMSMIYEDDDNVPIWFRQLSTDTMVEGESQTAPATPAQSRRFSGRHLDLDHVDPMESEYSKSSELSLQMKLDHFSEAEKLQVRKELYDQKNKLSLITHVPPPPLDTYVCVEGQAFTSKRKFGKVNSTTHLTDDVLHGVVFPKPGEDQLEVDDSMKDDNCERMAKERLSYATQHHIRSLLNQLLGQEELDSSWKDIILPVVRTVSEQVIPDVRRDDDMDIRQYFWFKKIPGGDKGDCQLISGVTFTKNVAHKKMCCSFQQPKILMLGCAIEYGQRVENKLASLDPLVLQEYEFLKNFVARLVAWKPNLVLVEKSVARVAQDMLLAAGITLIHNIKPSAMERVSRCTGADILQSMEQVTRPRLGSCQLFYLQKYPFLNGESKTLMFFEGCAPDLGCSLVLRGGTIETLAKVKRIMKYLTYVSYHLKLETRFLLDEFALPPSVDHLKPSLSTSSLSGSGNSKKSKDSSSILQKITEMGGEEGPTESEEEGGDQRQGTPQAKFRSCLDTIVLSSSPFCQYNLPFLLCEDAKNLSCRMFIPDKIYSSNYLGDNMDSESQLEEEDGKKEVHPNVIMKDAHTFTKPSVVAWLEDQKIQALVADYRARGGLVDLKMFGEYEVKERQRRKETATSVDLWSIAGRPCESSKDIEDFGEEEIFNGRYPVKSEPKVKLDCFNVYHHQRLAVLFSSYSSESHNSPKPCISPWAVFMEFYGRNDITLGGFLERYCFRPSYICPSHNCDVPMINHVRYFAHGTGSLYIHMRNLESPIPGYDRTILTWSWCKQCKQVTPVVPVSFESWSLSFAKYLELRFYGHQYKRRASAEPCQHSLHHEHYQYFSFANMVASFKYRKIELFEVLIPNLTVEIGKDRDPVEWCEDVRTFCTNAEIHINRLMDRIAALKNDKSTDATINANREMKVKEFTADIKKEYYHFNECVDCLKMKADSLRQAHFTMADTESTSSSAEDGPKESLRLKPCEMSTLKSDIANMLVNLKRDLCEIVDNWNAKLHEYVQQEKKREKTTRPPSPPPKGGESRTSLSSTTLDPGEFVQASSTSGNGKGEKTVPSPVALNGGIDFQTNYYAAEEEIVNLAQEPVSEVFYSSGNVTEPNTFLSRTSTPSHPMDTVSITSRDIDTQSGTPISVRNMQLPSDSGHDETSTENTIEHALSRLKDSNELLDFCENERNRKDSENESFMVIPSPSSKNFAMDVLDESDGPQLDLEPKRLSLGEESESTEPSIKQTEQSQMSARGGWSSFGGSSIAADQGSILEDEGPSERKSPLKSQMKRSSSDSKIFESSRTYREGVKKKISDAGMECISEYDMTLKTENTLTVKGRSNESLSGSSETGSDPMHEHWMIASKRRTGTVINTMDRCEDYHGGEGDGQRSSNYFDDYDAVSCCSSMVVEIYSEDEVSELSSVRGGGDYEDDDDTSSLSSDTEQIEPRDTVGSEHYPGIKVGESAVDYVHHLRYKPPTTLEEPGLDDSGDIMQPEQLNSSSSSPADIRKTAAMSKDVATVVKPVCPTVTQTICMDKDVKSKETFGENYFMPIQNSSPDVDYSPNTQKIMLTGDTAQSSNLSEFNCKTGSSGPTENMTTGAIAVDVGVYQGLGRTDVVDIKVINASPNVSKEDENRMDLKDFKDGSGAIALTQTLHPNSYMGSDLLPVHSRSEPALSQSSADMQNTAVTTFSTATLGHRRMASAPPLHVRRVSSGEYSYVDSPLTPGSPFICLQDSAFINRARSQSHGNPTAKVSSLHSLKEGQEELLKMAEQICQEDRRDVELDDPEEIQFEEGIEVAEVDAKSAEGCKELSMQGSVSVTTSEIGDGDDADVKRGSKVKKEILYSEGYDSGKESVESSSTFARIKRQNRQKSVPRRLQQLNNDVRDEADVAKLSSIEVSTSSAAPNKKGTEKMKKMLSQLLPGQNFQPLPSPFPPHEHYMLPPGESISIVINEKEPTSIIAYTLSSSDYYKQLCSVQEIIEGKTSNNTGQKSAQESPLPVKENLIDLKEPVHKPIAQLKSDFPGVVFRNQEKRRVQRPRSWAGSSNLRNGTVSLQNVLEQDEAEAVGLKFKQRNSDSLENLASGLKSLFSPGSKAEPLTPDGKLAKESQSGTPIGAGGTQQLDSRDLEEDIPDSDSVDDLLDDKDDTESIRSGHQEGKKKDDRKPSVDFHIKLQFQDSSSKFYCSVYFAEQFRKLRSIIFPEGEERYIRSLARCVLWRARGGKSGSSFSKSLDDRFVMKQMSRLELQSFVEFGPHYFEYINKAIKEHRPTAMAKLLGVYRIGFKNSQANTTMRQDILVMENLFYGKKVNKIFDLKGSVRSRYVHTSGKEDVLMDENLLEMICESPLFIRPHSKAILSKAIHNDTEFLAKQMVMDYSLLVGIDEVKFELVVGIIDYIRTFTWDKKLESYVKSTGILGGQGKMPTVVSPEVYQTRFMEAMHRYFLMVPDKWTGFGTELD